MKKKTIKVELIANRQRVLFKTEVSFIEENIHYFDVPRLDLTCWNNAVIKITVKEVEA